MKQNQNVDLSFHLKLAIKLHCISNLFIQKTIHQNTKFRSLQKEVIPELTTTSAFNFKAGGQIVIIKCRVLSKICCKK